MVIISFFRWFRNKFISTHLLRSWIFHLTHENQLFDVCFEDVLETTKRKKRFFLEFPRMNLKWMATRKKARISFQWVKWNSFKKRMINKSIGTSISSRQQIDLILIKIARISHAWDFLSIAWTIVSGRRWNGITKMLSIFTDRKLRHRKR